MKKFSYCRVCRINHDKGRGHRYGLKHKQNLVDFLSKARKKVQEIRLSLKEVSRLQDEDRARNSKFWCSFCEQEIDEKTSLFARESAIQHLGSVPHFSSLKNFWSEQGADVAERHRYLISNEDLSKWKALTRIGADTGGVEISQANNIHTNISHSSWETPLDVGSRQSVSHVATIYDVQPLSVLTLGSSQTSAPIGDGGYAVAPSWNPRLGVQQTTETTSNGWHASAGSSWDSPSCTVDSNLGIESSPSMSAKNCIPKRSEENVNRLGAQYLQVFNGGWGHSNVQQFVPLLPSAAPSQFTVVAAGQDLASIDCPPLLSGEGNVHSGAAPPWFGPSDDRHLFAADSGMECAMNQPLSRTQERKLAKLRPPNRVGAAWAEMRRAEIEREKRGEKEEQGQEIDAAWLPNFGRVWQSGSRHDTKKEYEAERRREAKRLGRPLGKRGVMSSEKPVQFQPYVSKRLRIMKTDE